MTRKIITVLVIVAGIGLVIYAYLFFKQQMNSGNDPFGVRLNQAALMLHISDPEKAEVYLPWLNELASSPDAESGTPMNPATYWAEIVHQLDSLYHVDAIWKGALSQGYLLSTGITTRGDNWFLSIPKTKEFSSKQLGQWLGASGTERSFEGSSIQTWPSRKWLSAEKNGCVVISPSPSMLEQLILDKKEDQTLLDEARKVASSDLPLHFYAAIDSAGWIELDPLFSEGHRSLSGYAIMPSGTQHLLNYHGAQSNDASRDVAKYLPQRTEMLFDMEAQDVSGMWTDGERYFENSDGARYLSTAWDDFSAKCMCNPDDAFFSWRDAEWGSAIISPNDSISYPVLFYKVRDSLQVIDHLKPALADSFSGNGVYPIAAYDLLTRNTVQLLPTEHRFFTQKGHFVFFSDAPDALVQIRNTGDSTSLARTANFRKSMQESSSHRGIMFYQTQYAVSPFPEAIMHLLSTYNYLSASLQEGGEQKTLVQIHLPGEANLSEENTEPAVISNIPNTYSAGPWSVRNHTTGAIESVAQNSSNELVWIDAGGKEVWKHALEGPIKGKVQQVDLLKNGKLQLLFSTSTKLYAIDKNGNDVSGFPVSPGKEIVSPVAVFDYENTRTYRFIVALSGGEVMNYTNEGTATEGWKYSSTGKSIVMIEHLRFGAEDHLLFGDTEGKIQDLKRNGSLRSQIAGSYSGLSGGYAFKPGVDLNSTYLYLIDGPKLYRYILGTGEKKEEAEGDQSSIIHHLEGISDIRLRF